MMYYMEVMTSPTDSTATYSLWHIPTSTLLVTTHAADEVVRRINLATADGIILSELLLNVEHDGALVGKQHLGLRILDVLHIQG